MKLVINIPCYNEEQTLPMVLEELPKSISGIDEIEVQIVNDGSRDATVEVAKKYGCRIVNHKMNMGLGYAFKHGMESALLHDADIMVNTDADNQYPSRYIADLVAPILSGQADIVIGNRKPWKVKHFSPLKRFFQYFGNMLTRNIAESDVPDMVSGFRAYSRDSLLMMNITTQFSYVLDTIVQASKKKLKIVSVDIETNAPTRKSRLFRNMYQHMWKSGMNLLRVYAIYEPFKTFLWIGIVFSIPAAILTVRFLYFYFQDEAGHVQSLVIAAILFTLSGLSFAIGLLAFLIGINRKLIEENLYIQKMIYFNKNSDIKN